MRERKTKKSELEKHVKEDFKQHIMMMETDRRLLTAMFGDKNGNPGIVRQVQEMHKVFTSANWMIKLVLKIFGAIGLITGAVIGLIELIKRLK